MQLALGVDCGGTRIRCGLVNRDGEIVGALHQREPRGEKTRATYVRAIITTITDALRDANQVAGIGIGMKGLVDHARGVSIYPPGIADWQNVPLAELIRRETGLPTWIENDVRVAALGEHWRGAAQGVDDFVFVILGTGIGAAIFREGKLARGISSSAGEWGHTIIAFGDQNFRCDCGQFGHWEALASGKSLARRAHQWIESGRGQALLDHAGGARDQITGQWIANAAWQGNPIAIEILRETGTYIGIGLANIINVENPALIVLGGGMIESANVWLETAHAAALKLAMKHPASSARIIPSALNANHAGILGAAACVWDQIGKPNQ